MFSASSAVVALLLTATSRVLAQDVETTPTPVGCETLLQRREWRTLADSEKLDYINAVKCLQSLPPLDPTLTAAQSRFDEFHALHLEKADLVHVTGEFLPWHRYYVKLYEDALRNECGYAGANPYWAWEQDADSASSISGSPVFDPVTGFGGNGGPGTYSLPPDTDITANRIDPDAFVGCVQDGPFKDYTLRYGPGQLVTDHCLTRNIRDDSAQFLDSKAMAEATQLPTYEEFRIELEGEPITPTHKMHDGGHYGVGGEMSNFYSSPGDPLFYLHHSNLDRVWRMWQLMLPDRLYEISGRSTVDPPYVNVTLDYPLDMGNLAATIPIRDVMDIWSPPNCYTYV
ncbi:hypothetical protein M413DRAFT_440244 [Hebeloma cylindrosporum]|uniref:Tyrosinase copper-binding domain-containing protein n=1 Tax=Hebeloma cylindrosporum TaxID=76867 RepID=A0A0C3CRE9_HEBCY|nr:hypothetical protein M413DRAFT_440244 [Hebeloma cylindrosporum h7]